MIFELKNELESKYANKVLTSSPVLTNITSDTVNVVNNIYDLKDEKDTKLLNKKILDMMLDKKVVTYDVVSELHSSGKLNFEGIEEVLTKYKSK